MCGLAGIASCFSLDKPMKSVFHDLMLISQLRGMDSTGIFTVDSNDKCNILKRALDATTFTQINQWRSLMTPADTRIMSGHCRAATRGGVTADNAHPFRHGDIVMMHNGTLTSQTMLAKANGFGTDSEAVAYEISQLGVDEIDKLTPKLNGAYALVWWDMRDQTINFLRNSERTLYYAVVDGKNKAEEDRTVIWASEIDMITLAAERRGLFFTNWQSFEPMVHHKLDLSGTKIAPKLSEKLEEYVPPKFQGNTQQYNTHYRNNTGVNGNRGGTTTGGKTGKKPVSGQQEKPANSNASSSSSVSQTSSTQANQKTGSPTVSGTTSTPAHPEMPSYMPKRGDTITIEPIEWKKYGYESAKDNMGKGIFLGGDDDQPYIVHMHSMDEAKFSSLTTANAYIQGIRVICTVMNVSWSHFEQEYVVTGTRIMQTKVQPPKEVTPEKKPSGSEQDLLSDSCPTQGRRCIEGPHGRIITLAQFNAQTKCGCAMCSRDIDVDDAPDIEWLDSWTPVCLECSAAEEFGRNNGAY